MSSITFLNILTLGASEAHTPMQIIDHLTPNRTLGVQVVIFLLALFLLNTLLFQPMLQYFDARNKNTVGKEADVVRRLQEVDKKTALIGEQIQKAREEGMKIRLQIREEGQKRVAELRGQALSQADKTIGEFRDLLHQKSESARQEVLGATRDVARELASKLSGRTVN